MGSTSVDLGRVFRVYLLGGKSKLQRKGIKWSHFYIKVDKPAYLICVYLCLCDYREKWKIRGDWRERKEWRGNGIGLLTFFLILLKEINVIVY